MEEYEEYRLGSFIMCGNVFEVFKFGRGPVQGEWEGMCRLLDKLADKTPEEQAKAIIMFPAEYRVKKVESDAPLIVAEG